MEKLIDWLSLNDKIVLNEPMKKHTTFRIGGLCDYYLSPSNQQDILLAVKICSDNSIPVTVLGNGSNVLVSDRGIEGLVIQICKGMNSIKYENNLIVAQGGAKLSRLASFAEDLSLSGFEFIGGIPGTVGGAVFMNAGAYGGEIGKIINEVTYFDGEQIVTKKSNELSFQYRKTSFTNKDYIILECSFNCLPGNRDEISKKMKEYAVQRSSKQPIEMPSAGSTFKRPEGDFAGRLIQEAGLMGVSVGGAMVSKKHAGFIVNFNNATYSDVACLIKKVQETVYEKFNVMLESEVKIIGRQ